MTSSVFVIIETRDGSQIKLRALCRACICRFIDGELDVFELYSAINIHHAVAALCDNAEGRTIYDR